MLKKTRASFFQREPEGKKQDQFRWVRGGGGLGFLQDVLNRDMWQEEDG